MKAPAIAFSAPEAVAIASVEVSPPRRHEIQVRTTFSMISNGTERWLLRNRLTWSPTSFPCVPGYQRSGIVTAVGAGVSDWRPGERALALTGTWSTQGLAPQLGGHSALANVPTAFAYHIPDQLEDLDASGAMLAQVGHSAVARAECTSTDNVLVIGDGLVGQCSAQAARATGARVILVGRHVQRLSLARRHSADNAIDSAAENASTTLREFAGSEGLSVVLDSVQTRQSQECYIDLLKRGAGRIVYNGFNPDDHWADVSQFQLRELTVHFVLHWTRERMQAALAGMAAGEIRMSPLVTHVVPFDRGPEMYQMILSKHEPFLGIALDWRNSE